MKIYKYEVPNEMILQYCKIIKAMEQKCNHNCIYGRARSELHNQIFNHVGCCRDCIIEDDKNFSIALEKIICDLTYKGD